MQLSRRTQADRSATTRAALIDAGRGLFASEGFAGVGTESIVRRAKVSRGALYHHFGDKTELFAAVLAQIEGEVTSEVAKAVLADPGCGFVEAMTRAVDAWLDACEQPDVRRVVLVDGPSVLGWERWREICQPHILGLIETVLAQRMADGDLVPLPAKPLAHMLLAMADEAALYVDAARDREAARRDILNIFRAVLKSLTWPPSD